MPEPVALDLPADDPLQEMGDWQAEARLVLGRDPEGRLCLRDRQAPRRRPLCLDFDNAEMRRRIAAGRRQPLARACGLHRGPAPHIVDATGGLGRDAATLAALGARLSLYERHPVMQALLADALARAPAAWREHIELHRQDSSTARLPSCDVIYLDPMFPDAGRRAAPGGEMQWLHRLVGEDSDFSELWARAREAAPARLVLKRPPRGARVRLAAPDASYGGGRAVYEVYFSPP